jgi:hypothetical protein
MNGKFLGGRTIKVMPVGRQDSTPQAQPIIDMVMSEARQYNRLFTTPLTSCIIIYCIFFILGYMWLLCIQIYRSKIYAVFSWHLAKLPNAN